VTRTETPKIGVYVQVIIHGNGAQEIMGEWDVPLNSVGDLQQLIESRSDLFSKRWAEGSLSLGDPLEFVRAALKRTGWAPTRLATEAGLSPTTLTRALNNPAHKFTLNTKTLQKIQSAVAKAEQHGSNRK
jgi:lambda repressor-like predicted transcriptional regulator